VALETPQKLSEAFLHDLMAECKRIIKRTREGFEKRLEDAKHNTQEALDILTECEKTGAEQVKQIKTLTLQHQKTVLAFEKQLAG